ncbi:hypothetical protein WJX81_002405 [Elliptochloris bilobata]|uniref:Phosphoglycerate mutase n=1 Tax=Elliptochloris bilobata TaxID=381761 RepID=A0AAW1RKC6_9CHLO
MPVSETRCQDGEKAQPLDLRNTYWLLRHGLSLANEAGLIVSSLENGMLPQHGLAVAGLQQATEAGQRLRQEVGPAAAAHVLVYASPFSRTLQTARAAAAELGGVAVTAEAALRERHFGAYELQSHDNYHKLWAADVLDPGARPPGGGESVEDVAARVRGLFQRLEATHRGATLLLVAHGDLLSILWAVAVGAPLRGHRRHAFGPGELRELVLMQGGL